MTSSTTRLSRSITLLPLTFMLAALAPSTAFAQVGIRSWGENQFGVITNAPLEQNITQINTKAYHTLALRADGSLEAWGRDTAGEVSGAPTTGTFQQVSAGAYHSMALRVDGSIQSWGSDTHGQVSSTPSGTNFIQVSAGWFNSIALRADGSIAAWGANDFGQSTGAPVGTGFIQVAAGASHAYALRANGTIEAWGNDDQGLVSSTPTGANFTYVSAGLEHSLALRSDGSIAAWGPDTYGQVLNTPPGNGFVEVAAGQAFSVALRADGSVVAWGVPWTPLWGVPAGSGFSSITAGVLYAHALNASASGEAFCFGDASGNVCPCGTVGASDAGCQNSVGSGAKLIALGNPSISNDSFRMQVSGAPDATPGLIFRAQNTVNGGFGGIFGDGLLCIAGQAARSQVQVTSAGESTFADFQGSPFGAFQLGAGTATNYQFWYRDNGNTCLGMGFNLSNAWRVTWGL